MTLPPQSTTPSFIFLDTIICHFLAGICMPTCDFFFFSFYYDRMLPCNVAWFWTWVSRLKFETFQVYRIFCVVTVPKDLDDFLFFFFFFSFLTLEYCIGFAIYHFWRGIMKWNRVFLIRWEFRRRLFSSMSSRGLT